MIKNRSKEIIEPDRTEESCKRGSLNARNNSMGVEERSIDLSLLNDSNGVIPRSEIGNQEEMIVDFEDEMPFDRNMKRNSTFYETGKRASEEFLQRLSVKHALLEGNQGISEKNSDSLIESNSRSIIIQANEHDESIFSCSKLTCGSLGECLLL